MLPDGHGGVAFGGLCGPQAGVFPDARLMQRGPFWFPHESPRLEERLVVSLSSRGGVDGVVTGGVGHAEAPGPRRGPESP